MSSVVCQDEVRALGRLPVMNVPEPFLQRHPFPGRQLAMHMLCQQGPCWMLERSTNVFVVCLMFDVKCQQNLLQCLPFVVFPNTA